MCLGLSRLPKYPFQDHFLNRSSKALWTTCLQNAISFHRFRELSLIYAAAKVLLRKCKSVMLLRGMCWFPEKCMGLRRQLVELKCSYFAYLLFFWTAQDQQNEKSCWQLYISFISQLASWNSLCPIWVLQSLALHAPLYMVIAPP